MSKVTVLAAAAAGYVLGTRAGRQRYDQIRAGASKVAHDPRVRNATGQVQDLVSSKVKETVSATVVAAQDRFGQRSDEPAPSTTPPAAADGPPVS